ncbi:unnamed protein product [Brassica oleracea var. botrytis]|uniref:(rape) hypothetical protein n=1 Tax=Brassica napus TaxID=3708 RepID=A0A816IFN7_BRANA|nr:unnamed protein product [Brassica napus]
MKEHLGLNVGLEILCSWKMNSFGVLLDDKCVRHEELITEEVSSESKRTSVFCSVDSCWEQELQLIAKHSYGIDIDLSFAYQSELSISSDQSPKHPWGAGSLAHCNRYP